MGEPRNQVRYEKDTCNAPVKGMYKLTVSNDVRMRYSLPELHSTSFEKTSKMQTSANFWIAEPGADCRNRWRMIADSEIHPGHY